MCIRCVDCSNFEDLVEIYNNTDEAISISGCSIRVEKDGALESQMKIAHLAEMEHINHAGVAFIILDDNNRTPEENKLMRVLTHLLGISDVNSAKARSKVLNKKNLS